MCGTMLNLQQFKCFAKCGFTEAVFADPEEEIPIDSAFMEVSWKVYANLPCYKQDNWRAERLANPHK